MPVSGAMDLFSLRCANLLVGNNEYSPALEITLWGPEIEFLSTMYFSITGSDFDATLDNTNIPGWESIIASKGSRLKINSINKGVRIYIAFSGGLEADIIMNSASTYLPGKTGGYRGRAIRKDDILPVKNAGQVFPGKRRVPLNLLEPIGDEKTLRIIPGVNYNTFAPNEREQLLGAVYSVTPYCDRMGLRLEGGLHAGSKSADVISYGIHYGAIQVPGDGNPIIMGADAQTTGGYRQFANVITGDLGRVAQMKPSDKVRFELTSHEYAISLLKERESIIKEIFR